MKQLIFAGTIIAMGFTFNNTVYSQGMWGVEAGVNFANIKGDGISDDTETRTGLLAAVYYQYMLENSSLVLQPELMYSQKGLEFDSDGVVKLDYIVAAGLAAYYFQVSDQLTPFIKAGPYVGYNITAKEEFNGDEEDIEGIKDIDAGVIIRAGIQFSQIEIGARMAQGLTDVLDDDEGKNSVFGLFVGIKL